MRLKSEQLSEHLTQQIKPVYLIYGDEPMLVEEAAEAVRKKARELGAEERQVWHVEGRFDWSQIQWQEQSMSLFSSQRLLEVRLPSGTPGKDGAAKLADYVKQMPEATTLLIISGKLASAQQKSKWFSALDNIGVTVPVWPVDAANLPRWLSQRAYQQGLKLDNALAILIAERVEGNLFAAAQEINKLALLCPDGNVDEQTVLASVSDNARFEAFGLMDTAFAGDAVKLPRMISRLRAEGLEVLAVFSAVSWSMHRLIDMAMQLEAGAGLEQVFAAQKPPVWDKNKPLMRQVLARHKRQDWRTFINLMSQIDKAAKGSLAICPWSLLEQLCMRVAGVATINN